jgi:hypothetical protein
LQDYLPVKDGKVVCACLSQEYIPGAEKVILVGRGPNAQKQAELFCAQDTFVPVFFKKIANLWEYAGDFKVRLWTDDPEEIARFERSSGRSNLSGIIFLQEAK